MCGIVGFIGQKNRNINYPDEMIVNMINKLNHRGPDNQGKWIDKSKDIYLGHTRLSILDLSVNGNQPMTSHSNRYVICYNGEIYNHLSLRSLKLNDYPWKGYSDTETLLQLIEEFGLDETLSMIDGMFAFALYDKETNTICLVRDKVGEKPLYYGFLDKSFVFTSELHGIEDFNLEINFEAIEYYLKYQYIPAPLSIYKNIFKLEPGCYLNFNISNEFEKNSINYKKWWNIKDIINRGKTENLEKKSIKQRTKNIINDSVNNQLISDVPIGSFLSGGIDSSLITAMMSKISNNKIKTFTIGLKDNEFDESIYASKISKILNTDHNELILSEKDVQNNLFEIINSFDEPFADSSQIPTFLISRFAKKSVKVCLTGDGGDELFGGYNRYIWSKNVMLIMKYTPFRLRKTIAQLILNLPKSLHNLFVYRLANLLGISSNVSQFTDKSFKFLNLIKTLKNFDDLYSYLITEWKQSDKILNAKFTKNPSLNIHKLKYLNDQENMMLNDTLYYLPNDILYKVDRSSMANGLETRAPFLSNKVIDVAWKIPFNYKIDKNKKFGKKILTNILSDYLPNEMFERPKMGFSIPLAEWLRGDLKSFVYDTFSANQGIINNIFNKKIIDQHLNDHMKGNQNWQHKLWSLTVLFNWLNNKNIKI